MVVVGGGKLGDSGLGTLLIHCRANCWAVFCSKNPEGRAQGKNRRWLGIRADNTEVAVLQIVFRGEPPLLCMDNADCRTVIWVETGQGPGHIIKGLWLWKASSLQSQLTAEFPWAESDEGKEGMETDFWRLWFLINCSEYYLTDSEYVPDILNFL